MGKKQINVKKVALVALKIILSVASLLLSAYVGFIAYLTLSAATYNIVLSCLAVIFLPSLFLPLIWLKKRKKFILIWLCSAVVYSIALTVNFGIIKHNEKITVDTSPNIDTHEYLPFDDNSKIVKLDSKTLKLSGNLPRIDGAAALFPVYSAFVNAVYPEYVTLYEGTFEYNNTLLGYLNLASKNTDIFIGLYPSDDQRKHAEECGTTFVYTPIGSEAFVFFVHKDNPIENLTTEQIKDIYSGKITNWKQVGGKNEKIEAFQRNKGSGSQSMLERFMGDTPIMDAPTELVNEMMVGIIEQVSNYKSKSNSIGFSFRYYVEGIIKNPDIRMLSVDGVAPTKENLQNGTYPIVTPIYAVTYEDNPNENVKKFVDWMLSDEGQYIINETGYVGIAN